MAREELALSNFYTVWLRAAKQNASTPAAEIARLAQGARVHAARSAAIVAQNIESHLWHEASGAYMARISFST